MAAPTGMCDRNSALQAQRRRASRRGLLAWSAAGWAGLTTLSGLTGLTGLTGLIGLMGLTGLTGLSGCGGLGLPASISLSQAELQRRLAAAAFNSNSMSTRWLSFGRAGGQTIRPPGKTADHRHPACLPGHAPARWPGVGRGPAAACHANGSRLSVIPAEPTRTVPGRRPHCFSWAWRAASSW